MAGIRPGRRAVIAALCVVAALGATGCVNARPVAPEAIANDRRTLSSDALDLAVRGGTFRSDQRALSRAEAVLTGRCMAANGFAFPVAVTNPYDDDEWRPDLRVRRERGYGLRAAGRSGESEYLRRLSPAQRHAYERALSGSRNTATLRLSGGQEFTYGTSGCTAEGRAGLYGDVASAVRVFYVPQQAHLQVRQRLVDAAPMREAIARWTTCMSQRGLPYPSMAAARAAAAAAAGPAAVALERRIAVADGECALAVGTTEVVDRVGRAYAAELPIEQIHELNAVAAVRARALQRASELGQGSNDHG
jgi:hypothetical protein